MEVLSVIIPVFDEERTIAALIDAVLAVDLSALGLTKELVIVNDASRDHTLVALRPFMDRPDIQVLSHEINRGKGAALQTLSLIHIGRGRRIERGKGRGR